MDTKIKDLINSEIDRQGSTIDLIASENFASPDILKILGSPLVNKYSEGYPGKRYYPGNKYYDELELLAQKYGLEAFGLSPDAWALNVQPYSGSPANLAVYVGLMNIGDVLMGMSLATGGHLTHGHKASFTGKAFKAVQYGIGADGVINYDEVQKLATENKPKVIVAGYTAYTRIVDWKRFSEIAKSVGAYLLADVSHISGLIAGGAHPSPFPYADVVMTTTHKTLRGPRGAVIFSRKAISEKIDKAVFPGLQGGPHNATTAAIAQMFYEVKQPGFKEYAEQIVKNAKALGDGLMAHGFTLIGGRVENHLMLVDMRNKGVDGAIAEKLLEESHIVANRNSVPGDPSPFKPSGVRIGTPSITTRGMKEGEMKMISDWIYRALDKKESPAEIKKEVEALCKKFPLPYNKL